MAKEFVALIYLSGMEAFGDPSMLATITTMKMPFGKYKGRVLCELPVEYLEWFARKGFPPGKMGMLLSTVYEIKLNGLEYLLAPIKKLDKR